MSELPVAAAKAGSLFVEACFQRAYLPLEFIDATLQLEQLAPARDFLESLLNPVQPLIKAIERPLCASQSHDQHLVSVSRPSKRW